MQPRRTVARLEQDGVRVVETRSSRKGVWALAAVVLAAVAALSTWWLRPDPPPPATAETVQVAEAPAAAPVVRQPEPPPVSAAPAPGPPAPGPDGDPGYTIDPEGGGIGLYPPLGTRPPLAGIVVPEGYELPEGYVRHQQVTDDGELLPPILMFHPDYDLLDADGVPVELPADRVVPPELAPEGMPIEMLELPEGGAPSALDR